jgi:sugar diacid utilization regulator
VENFIPASCALEHQGNVVVYVNLDLCDLTQDVISQKLAGFIRDSLLQAGYSRRMLGHFNFQRQYVQAYISIQVGSRKHPTSWIHHFNTIALPYMLEQITEALPSYMICHEQLLQLKYEDERTGSQLYETLRCYLTHQQSATKTAAALYIHRSTLLYRLEKIQDQLKADLSDPDEQLYLMLSFKLMDQENR